MQKMRCGLEVSKRISEMTSYSGRKNFQRLTQQLFCRKRMAYTKLTKKRNKLEINKALRYNNLRKLYWSKNHYESIEERNWQGLLRNRGGNIYRYSTELP